MWTKLKNNIGLKILAFCMALVTAVLVKTLASPIRELPTQQVYTKTIDVISPEDKELIGTVNVKEVNVTVRGKKNVVNRIDPNLISAVVDLTNRTGQGSTLESVDVMVPGGAKVTQVTPSHVWASVSKRAFLNVPVRVELKGSVSPDCIAEAPICEPSAVRIAGSEENIKKVKDVAVSVAVSGLTDSISTKVSSLVPVDEKGNKVSDVSIYKSEVDVTVPVVPIRTLSFDLKNITVKGGRSNYSIKCIPKEVVISGSALRHIKDEKILLPPCSFEALNEKQVRLTAFTLPEGMKLVNSSNNVVTIIAEPLVNIADSRSKGSKK